MNNAKWLVLLLVLMVAACRTRTGPGKSTDSLDSSLHAGDAMEVKPGWAFQWSSDPCPEGSMLGQEVDAVDSGAPRFFYRCTAIPPAPKIAPPSWKCPDGSVPRLEGDTRGTFWLWRCPRQVLTPRRASAYKSR